MRKLKVALLLLFAALLSLALFACSSGDDEEEGGRITQLTIRGTISLTDADTSAALPNAMKGLTVYVRYEGGGNKSVEYELDKCTLEGTEAIATGANGKYVVGTYYVSLKTENEFTGSDTEREVQVDVGHHFVTSSKEGIAEECSEDGATKTVEEISAHLHYYNFHSDGGKHYVLEPDSANPGKTMGDLKPMENTVAQNPQNALEKPEIKSVTAGRLVKGTSITLTGTALTSWKADGLEKDAGYYFPVLGFADVNNDPAHGGTSVFVRNEGWVLWNGVGTPRMLAALAGGTSVETPNYGSYVNATGTKPAGYGTRRPASVDQWTTWYTYSEGTTSDTRAYNTRQNVEFTWTYREDGILELVYTNLTGSYNLVCRTKVPDAEYYDTLIHGDYVDMTFSKITRIDTLTLKDVQYVGLKSGAKTDYLENESLVLSDFHVQAKYEQTGDTWNDVTTFDIEATTDEDVTETSEWISLKTNVLSSDMQHFRVSLTVGNKTLEKEIDTSAEAISAGKWPHIYANPFAEGFGGDNGLFKNNGGIGNISYKYGGAANTIELTVTGLAQVLTENLKENGGFDTTYGPEPTGYNRFISIKLFTGAGASTFAKDEDGLTFSAKSDKANGERPFKVVYSDDGESVGLVIALKADDNKITLTGLHSTAIYVLNLERLGGFDVASSVTSGTPAALNKSNEYKVTYTFENMELYNRLKKTGTATGEIEWSLLYVTSASGTGSKALKEFTLAEGVRSYVLNGVTVSFTEEDYQAFITGSDPTLEVTYKLPAVDPWNISNYTVQFRTDDGRTTQASDILAYKVQFEDERNGGWLEGNVYTEIKGTTIYIAVAKNVTDVQTSGILEDPDTTQHINVQNGKPYTLTLNKDLTLKTKYLKDLTGKDVSDAFEVKVHVLGTLDEPRDNDYGYVIVYKIDTTKLGVASDATEYYFDLPDCQAASGSEHYYLATKGTPWTLTQKTLSGDEDLELIYEGDCRDASIVAYSVEGGKFYAHPYTVGGSHVEDGNSGVCKYCGASISKGGSFSGTAEGLSTAAVAETIGDGEYVRLRGTYSMEENESGFTEYFPQFCSGIETSIYSVNESSWVRIRNDGYYEIGTGSGSDFSLAYNSTNQETPNGTLEGMLNEDGETINTGVGGNYLTQGNVPGATFDITATYVNGYVVVLTQLWTAENELWVEWTGIVKVNTNLSHVVIGFRIDQWCGTIGGIDPVISANNVSKWVGKVAPSSIDTNKPNTSNGFTTGELTGFNSFKGNKATVVSNYYTEISAPKDIYDGKLSAYTNVRVEGNAPKLSGLENKFTEASFGATDRYVALAINLKSGVLAKYSENATKITDIDGKKATNAIVKFSGDMLYVAIALKADGSSAKHYIVDLTGYEGYMLQNDIKLDLTNVALSDVTIGEVTNNLKVTGGSITIEYSGADLSTEGYKAQINKNAAQDLAATKNLGDGITVTSVSNSQIVLSLTPNYNEKFCEYEFIVTNNQGEVVMKMFFAPDGVDSSTGTVVTLKNGAHVAPHGNILTIVAEVDGQSLAQEYFINVNAGAATNENRLAVYNMSFVVDKTYSLFTWEASNLLQSKASVILSEVGGKHYATLNIDLTDLGIGASTAYGFEIGHSADVGSTVEGSGANYKYNYTFYTVNDKRDEIVKVNGTATGARATVVAGSGDLTGGKVESVNRAAYAYGDPVTFYYGVEVTPGHDFVAQSGYYVCKDEGCGAVYKEGSISVGDKKTADIGGKPFRDADKVNDLIESGITVSFEATAGSSDWDAKVLTVGPADHEFNITLPNLDSYGVEVEDNKFRGFNLFPSEFENGGAWNSFLNKTSYVTITISKTDGIKFYQNGVLKIKYSASATMNPHPAYYKDLGGDGVNELPQKYPTVGEYAAAFLAQLKETGLKLVQGAIAAQDVFIHMSVLTADQVAARYENFKWERHEHGYFDSNDKCVLDGVLNPSHGNTDMGGKAHSYSSTTDKCIYCGALNPNHGNTGMGGLAHRWDGTDHCELCGILNPAHVHEYVNYVCKGCAQLEPGSGFTAMNKEIKPSVWDTSTVISSKITKGKTLTVIGLQVADQIESNTAYSVVFEFVEGWTFRSDNAHWDYGAGTNNFETPTRDNFSIKDASDDDVEFDWAIYKKIAANANWMIEVSWANDGTITLTVTLTATAGECVGYTYTCAYTTELKEGVELKELTLKVGGDHMSSLKFAGYKTKAIG